VLVVIAVATGRKASSRLALKKPRTRFIVSAILLGFGLTPWLSVIQSPFIRWLPQSHYAESLVQRESFGSYIALSVIVGPLCEELVFRGVLTRSLATAWSRPRALTVAALAFALHHASPYQLVDPFLFGLVVGYLTLQSGSIVPGLIVHAMGNARVAISWYHRPAAVYDVLRVYHSGFLLLGAFAILIAFALAVRADRTKARHSSEEVSPAGAQ
jgi:membrane protease YdiL (CAAX protease family)